MLKWTDRKFNFDFPASMMPIILVRLKGTTARLEEMTRNVPDEKLKARPGSGWSVKEHIGHLIDLEALHEGRIEDYRNNLPLLRMADMSNEKTYSAGHNSKNCRDLIAELKTVRSHFIHNLKTLKPDQSSQHPRLKQPMRVVDMAFFVAEHDDHHLEIIDRMIQNAD